MPTNTTGRHLGWAGVVYPPGVDIPDVVAIAYGLGAASPAADESAAEPASSALQLINSVSSSTSTDLTNIPTIGAAGAKIIFDQRPEGGYESIEHVEELCPQLSVAPYRTDWVEIAEWAGADA